MNLAIFSKLYIPIYNFHEALEYDVMIIGLKYMSQCMRFPTI